MSQNDTKPSSSQSDQPVQPARRSLLLMLATLPAACAVVPLRSPLGTPQPQPGGAVTVRPPLVGQEWVYAVYNVYNSEPLGVITERVVAVGEQIRIQRIGDRVGPLPDEIQSPWGQIL